MRLFSEATRMPSNVGSSSLSDARPSDRRKCAKRRESPDPSLPQRTHSQNAFLLSVGASLLGGAAQEDVDDGQTGRCVLISSGTVRTAVFKPTSGENFARQGLDPGQGAVREEAAYMLDHLSGRLAGVPVTVRARMDLEGTETKGAMQQFVDNGGCVEDFGVPRDLEVACQRLDLECAQAVAALDMRICNTDRHGGNLLLCGGPPAKLAPIDHGCAFPPWWSLGELVFDAWEGWPQVSAPVCERVASAVAAAAAGLPTTVSALCDLGLEEPALVTLQIGTSLLASGVAAGQPLSAIAKLMLRDDFAEPSWLELQVHEAAAATLPVSAEFERDDRGDAVLVVEPHGPPWEDPSVTDAFLAELSRRFVQHWAQ